MWVMTLAQALVSANCALGRPIIALLEAAAALYGVHASITQTCFLWVGILWLFHLSVVLNSFTE